jgi:hypothetical protein
MAEITVMDILLLVLSALFLGIGFAMRRLRNKMEVDMRKNIMPYMGMRHMFKHKMGEHQIKKKR